MLLHYMKTILDIYCIILFKTLFCVKGVDLEDMSYKNVHILDETLYINSINEEQNGEYQCAGINQAGTGYSNALTIKVESKNSIL